MQYKKDWTTSSNLNNYLTFNREHNGKDLSIQLRNQQTCISNNHNQIWRDHIFNWFLLLLHYRFVNATQFLFCKKNWWKREKNEPKNAHIQYIYAKLCTNLESLRPPPLLFTAYSRSKSFIQQGVGGLHIVFKFLF